jgi:hypothetical protein
MMKPVFASNPEFTWPPKSVYNGDESGRRSMMPAVEEVMTIVEQMTEEERMELRRRLDAIDEQEWQKELDESTRQFQAAGMTDDDIDEAVRKLRYEGRP